MQKKPGQFLFRYFGNKNFLICLIHKQKEIKGLFIFYLPRFLNGDKYKILVSLILIQVKTIL
ncbi:MAG: hypothetical protein A2Y94_13190 [Caldithrix sp. RBG_13_44_9]|nr:MAG: hypothetical protein A2Y94_13190 [Caldithrix sp. RBG_13_44_9]